MAVLFNFHLDFRPPSAPVIEDLSGQAYYLHSQGLWGVTPEGHAPGTRLQDGVPWRRYPHLGWQVNPAYVAWWGLINLNLWLRQAQKESYRRLGAALAWLRANQVARGPGVVWFYAFDWPHGASTLRAPWISGLSQALAASLLWRASRLLSEPSLAQLADQALFIFQVPLEQGGLRTHLQDHAYFEEYPFEPCTYVLDGFLFALLAFNDQKVFTGQDGLWREGLASLLANLDFWDWQGYWSRYGNFGYLCSVEYHLLNVALLRVLAQLSGRPELTAKAERWNAFHASPLTRLRVALAYYASNARYTLGQAGILKQFLRRNFLGSSAMKPLDRQ